MWRWVYINGWWYRVWDGYGYLAIISPAVPPPGVVATADTIDCTCEQPRLNEARLAEQNLGAMPSRPDECR